MSLQSDLPEDVVVKIIHEMNIFDLINLRTTNSAYKILVDNELRNRYYKDKYSNLSMEEINIKPIAEIIYNLKNVPPYLINNINNVIDVKTEVINYLDTDKNNFYLFYECYDLFYNYNKKIVPNLSLKDRINNILNEIIDSFPEPENLNIPFKLNKYVALYNLFTTFKRHFNAFSIEQEKLMKEFIVIGKSELEKYTNDNNYPFSSNLEEILRKIIYVFIFRNNYNYEFVNNLILKYDNNEIVSYEKIKDYLFDYIDNKLITFKQYLTPENLHNQEIFNDAILKYTRYGNDNRCDIYSIAYPFQNYSRLQQHLKSHRNTHNPYFNDGRNDYDVCKKFMKTALSYSLDCYGKYRQKEKYPELTTFFIKKVNEKYNILL